MPIKYNLTKYDILAEKFHELIQKNNSLWSKDEEMCYAEATLIASFASPHSWQTHKTIMEGNIVALNSPEIKNEYLRARANGWKLVKNTDIQEVARMNIRDNIFYYWLSIIGEERNRKETYKKTWNMLKQHINEECDGISIQRQH